MTVCLCTRVYVTAYLNLIVVYEENWVPVSLCQPCKTGSKWQLYWLHSNLCFHQQVLTTEL